MTPRRMHADEVDVDLALVRRLVAEQFPQWASLPVHPVSSAATDNAIYRLGQDMVVRLPRRTSAREQLPKELRWLPRLAPSLPLPVPVPLATGTAAGGYPWEWAVYRWLPGETAILHRIADRGQVATELAGFIAALQRIDAAEGPVPGPHNFFRGAPLITRDAPTREALCALAGHIDGDAAVDTWEVALAAPPWGGPPVWIHGDLQPTNLLLVNGRLSAVIDFGGLGVGDPACDLMVAWGLLSAESRGIFRTALGIDEPTWVRGRGWALSVALIALPYYKDTNPVLAATARRTIREVLLDRSADEPVHARDV